MRSQAGAWERVDQIERQLAGMKSRLCNSFLILYFFAPILACVAMAADVLLPRAAISFLYPIANLIFVPVFMAAAVAHYQWINSRGRDRFAWGLWAFLTTILCAPSVSVLICGENLLALPADWWPLSLLINAPISAWLIVVMFQGITMRRRGTGFAWKAWALVAIGLLSIQSTLLWSTQDMRAARYAERLSQEMPVSTPQ